MIAQILLFVQYKIMYVNEYDGKVDPKTGKLLPPSGQFLSA